MILKYSLLHSEKKNKERIILIQRLHKNMSYLIGIGRPQGRRLHIIFKKQSIRKLNVMRLFQL